MPPTAAELIRDLTLGPLVDHYAFALVSKEEPLAWARETVRILLKGRTDQGRIDDAVLVVSELLTNAIRHAGGPVSLTLDLYEKGVTVGVVDRGRDTTVIPTVPVSLLASLQDEEAAEISGEDLPENGQGLYLVSSFATAWGVEPAYEGKVVTAAFCLAGSTA
ncbi:ATP-binding protein (plasmid) [Streptomyces sp. NBC_01456]|uniref:ATP-binding protein n=1 Tax=unclassified Streptomyces TaxID=2593676 RepID=UPI002E375920|nr:MULTISPECIES: ATP-binding protein [unclassified Streptomyces]